MTDYQTWAGNNVYDVEGKKIGSVADLYFDEDANKPDWATVKSGLFGTKVHFVPLHEASVDEDGIHVSVTEEQVKDAPSVGMNDSLDADEEERLYRHYGITTYDYRDRDDTTVRVDDSHRSNDRQDDTMQTARVDTSADHAVIEQKDGTDFERSRDDVVESTTSQPSGPVTIGQHPVTGKRVRLQKYIVTEMVKTTVPIQHEEVRVVGEPIDDKQLAGAGDNRTR